MWPNIPPSHPPSRDFICYLKQNKTKNLFHFLCGRREKEANPMSFSKLGSWTIYPRSEGGAFTFRYLYSQSLYQTSLRFPRIFSEYWSSHCISLLREKVKRLFPVSPFNLAKFVFYLMMFLEVCRMRWRPLHGVSISCIFLALVHLA